MLFILFAFFSLGFPQGHPIGDIKVPSAIASYNPSTNYSTGLSNYNFFAGYLMTTNLTKILSTYYTATNTTVDWQILSNSISYKFSLVTNNTIYYGGIPEKVTVKSYVLGNNGQIINSAEFPDMIAPFMQHTDVPTNFIATNTAWLGYATWTNTIAYPIPSGNQRFLIWSRYDFSKMDAYWGITNTSQLPADTKPDLQWNTACPLWPKEGLSAMSQCSTYGGLGGTANGHFSYAQNPATLITPRHAVAAFHPVNYREGGLNRTTGYLTNWPGHRVYYCKTNNVVVEAIVQSAYYDGTNDFLMIMYSNNVVGIDPMPVTQSDNISDKLTSFTYLPVIIGTGFGVEGPAFCPTYFNTLEMSFDPYPYTGVGSYSGCSGNADMISVTNGANMQLILCGKRTGAGPGTYYQSAIDKMTVDAALNTNSYRLNWWYGYTNYPNTH